MLVMLGVCAMVVMASAFMWVMAEDGTEIADLPNDVDQPDDSDASSYDGDAASLLAELSALEPVAAAADREAMRAVQEAQASAAASLDAAVAQARLAVDEALAASMLPPVPEGYVPGMAVEAHVSASKGYALPSLPGLPATGDLPGIGLQGDPSPVGSRSGTLLPLGDLLAQLEGAQATLEGLVGELPVGDLPVGGLPVGGLPVGAPAPTPDAEGTVAPDEQGAQMADLHADRVLTATSSAYGQTRASLVELLAAYEKLAEQVEQAVDETRALQEQADADIQATLEGRLAAIEAETLRLEAEANQIASVHARAIATAKAEADAALEKALRAQVGAIQDAGDEAMASLQASVDAVQAEADTRQAEIVAIVDRAAVELSKPGAPADAAARFDAVQAAATSALAKVDRDAKAQIAVLQQSSVGLEAEASAAVLALETVADEMRAQLNATLADSLDEGLEAKSYLVAVARAQAELAGRREVAEATAALAELETLADGHVEGLVRAGLKSASDAGAIVPATRNLVGHVEGIAVGEVAKDLDYIQKVSEDYSKVPTEDRRERAGHWSAAASEIAGVLDQTVATGHALEGLAAQAAQAALVAKAEITAMA